MDNNNYYCCRGAELKAISVFTTLDDNFQRLIELSMAATIDNIYYVTGIRNSQTSQCKMYYMTSASWYNACFAGKKLFQRDQQCVFVIFRD